MGKIMDLIKQQAYHQMDAMWHDGSGLATIDMVKFKHKGYCVVNPWMDEKTRKPVNPWKYYGKRKTAAFIREMVKELKKHGLIEPKKEKR